MGEKVWRAEGSSVFHGVDLLVVEEVNHFAQGWVCASLYCVPAVHVLESGLLQSRTFLDDVGGRFVGVLA